jgi:hypothetical protein
MHAQAPAQVAADTKAASGARMCGLATAMLLLLHHNAVMLWYRLLFFPTARTESLKGIIITGFSLP